MYTCTSTGKNVNMKILLTAFSVVTVVAASVQPLARTADSIAGGDDDESVAPLKTGDVADSVVSDINSQENVAEGGNGGAIQNPVPSAGANPGANVLSASNTAGSSVNPTAVGTASVSAALSGGGPAQMNLVVNPSDQGPQAAAPEAKVTVTNGVSEELSRLLSQLYGKAVTDMAKDPESYAGQVLEVDCRNRQDDNDSKVNIVTTLCPFLRDDDEECGSFRHASFTAMEPEKLCSEACRKNIDGLMTALPNRKHLARSEEKRRLEAPIFNAIVNSILIQYASQCRVGNWFMPN
jgi:hypothetical protein